MYLTCCVQLSQCGYEMLSSELKLGGSGSCEVRKGWLDRWAISWDSGVYSGEGSRNFSVDREQPDWLELQEFAWERHQKPSKRLFEQKSDPPFEDQKLNQGASNKV